MAPPQRDDPYKAFNFLVQLEGVASASFSEASGLESETTIIEYRVGDNPIIRKLAGLTMFRNIVLRRGITLNRDLYDWRKSIIEGNPDRRDGQIILLDDQRNEVLRWNFSNGWLCKWEGPTLSAESNEVAIESIEIAHEGLELE